MTWRTVPLSDVARIQGGIQKQPKRTPRSNSFPFLRVANVTAKGLNLAEVHNIELFDGEIDRYRLDPGDLLVVEGNGSASQIGRAAVWNGAIPEAVHQNHLIRVRPSPDLDARYLGLLWNAPEIRDELSAVASSTSGLYTLSVAKLKNIAIPLPTVKEQRRIVDILEDHLSRLDAAVSYMEQVLVRTRALVRSILLEAVPERGRSGWRMVTVEQAGSVDLGRQRHPDWHNGPEMRPYLRVANVFEDRIDTNDVMSMDFTGVFERFKLHDGDVLLNEGQSPHLLGRPAIYRGDPPDVAFTNSILRFRANNDVLPEWALLVFRRHMHAGRFTRESRITTNIAHLSAKRFKSVEFPLPGLEEQYRLVGLVNERLASVTRVRSAATASQLRADGLRRALLRAAFSGQLTGRASDLDQAEAAVG